MANRVAKHHLFIVCVVDSTKIGIQEHAPYKKSSCHFVGVIEPPSPFPYGK